MIKIIPFVPKMKKVCDPYYVLTYSYMIGDANGNTEEELDISVLNPYLERYIILLNSLKPTKGTWGLILREETIYKAYKEGQMSSDDFAFLNRVMFSIYSDSYPEDEEYLDEFYEGVRDETEYSFLVFEGLTLKYIDEYGNLLDTLIE